ncbi:MAG: hypothetical protein ACI35S_06635 [Anaeroplasma sp.]
MKVLFLDIDLDDFGDFFRKQRNSIPNVDSMKLYSNAFPLVRKLFLFLGLHVSSFFLYFIYGNWKKKINNYDFFVIPSRKSCKYALKILKKKKVAMFYWNIITEKEIAPLFIKKHYPNVLLCTFDHGDAEKYDIVNVDNYYFNLKGYLNKECISQDLFYVGIDRKNRRDILNQLNDLLGDKYILNFHIMNYDDKENRLKYEDIISNNLRTKCIVDLTRENQTGITLRPLEALMFEKKLITNNKEIIKYPFYNKNNVFILGIESLNDIEKFIDSPFIKIDKKIKEKYYFENWLNNVINCYNSYNVNILNNKK